MAAFNRLTEATYEVHETVKVDTQDNEDHTFCGIMFPVKCKSLLPVDHVSIRSVAVRGQLGPMTVWVSKLWEDLPPKLQRRIHNNGATTMFRLNKAYWTKVYEANHGPSPTVYQALELDEPVILKPGQVRAIYIHSTLPGDQAIVYDNASFLLPRRALHPFASRTDETKARHDDAMISIYSGRAHVCNSPFGQMPIWGWGNAWRDHREFVGRLEYGVRFQLWNPTPEMIPRFGPNFQQAFWQLKMCQTRWESPISRLPDECLYYVLNMCRWDWFQDNRRTMETQHKEQTLLLRLKQQQQEEEAKPAAVDEASEHQDDDEEKKPCARQHHRDSSNRSHHDANDDDSTYVDAMEGLGYEGLEDDGDNNMDHESEGELAEDDDEYVEEDDDDDDDDDDDSFGGDDEEGEDDDDDSWERANGYRADHNVFRFVDREVLAEQHAGEAEDEEEEGVDDGSARQAWIRRQFERIHVLRALAREQDDDDDDAVADMHLVF